MTFADQLKNLRRQKGLSQEKLAEELHVSRQAITKWETAAGIPDIENLKTISAFFNVSIDSLLSQETAFEPSAPAEPLYESVTEYDITEPKHYDIKLGGANNVVLQGYNGEKLKICLSSDAIETIQENFKVKLDDIKNRIDVDLIRKNTTESEAKQHLTILIQLPLKYIRKAELSAAAESLLLKDIEAQNTELDIKTKNLTLDNVNSKVEVNCNCDMEITLRSLLNSIDINQLSASSKLYIPQSTDFNAASKGRHTEIFYEKDGKKVQPFNNPASDKIIELNGMKSELIICEY